MVLPAARKSPLSASGTCTFKRGFLRGTCGGAVYGVCVYCGEPFCERHGHLGEDYVEVCARLDCQAKREDVEQHRAWIRAHFARSQAGRCVHDDCAEPNEHECQRCRLRFCPDHLKAGTVKEQTIMGVQRLTMMLCAHCLARRKLWD